MRIFIMGPVGVGKSHAIDHLASKGFVKDNGYKVVLDPIIALSEEFLSGDDSLLIQTTVATSLFQTAAMGPVNAIYDSCLVQSLQFVKANKELGFVNESEYESLKNTYETLMNIVHRASDVLIYLDKPEEVVDAQIAKRGRPYEQDNPFIRKTNEVIAENLVLDASFYHTGTVLKVDVSQGYQELEDLIVELQGGQYND